MAAHPQNWRGREISNPPEDTAKQLVNIMNFLMPPPNLGDMPGDAARYDKKGNLLILKEEPITSSSEDESGIIKDSPPDTRNNEGCNCCCHNTAPNENQPIPSTSTYVPEINDLSIPEVIPGHLEISGAALANMFNEFFKEMDVSIMPKKANISGRWVFDGRVNRTQLETDQDQVTTDQEQVPDQLNQDLTRIGGNPNLNDQGQGVPVSSDPVPAPTDQVILPGNTAVEDIIQILDDHIAQTEKSEKPPSETDPLEELLTFEQEEQESESEPEEEGIVNVSDSSDEITINPTEIEVAPETREQRDDNTPQESNNNQDEQKAATQKPSSWRNTTRTPSQQLMLHWVPITFPVAGNLLDSEDSLKFIIEALGSLVGHGGILMNLPMGMIVNATPLHRVTSYQARSAVILTFDTTETRDRI